MAIFPSALDEHDTDEEKDETEYNSEKEWKAGICKHERISVSSARCIDTSKDV